MMSLIEDLPLEISMDILELACLADLDEDEDGRALYRTALSLCRVSRYFYSLAVPLLYRNVFVAGRTKLGLLALTLRARPELGLCATHVLLSDRMVGKDDIDSPPKFAFWFPRGREERIAQQQRMQDWWDARMRAIAELRLSVIAIIRAVAPSVRSMSICLYLRHGKHQDSSNVLPDILTYHFPELRELVLSHSANPLPLAAPFMPGLTQLHLAGGDDGRMYDALRRQTTLSPALRYMRLTGTPCDAEALSALEDALFCRTPAPAPGSDTESSEADAAAAAMTTRGSECRPLAETLARIDIVAPSVAKSPAPGATTPESGSEARERLVALAARVPVLRLHDVARRGRGSSPGPGPGPEPGLVVGQGTAWAERYTIEEARRAWVDGILRHRTGF